MIYTIYHIPGIKIGCTDNVLRRIQQQGFTEYEVLETHTDIYLASNREIELQKEYGLPIDKVPYYKVLNISNVHSCRKGAMSLIHSDKFKEVCSAGQAVAAKNRRLITFQQAQEIRSKYVKFVYTKLMLAKEYNVSIGSIEKILDNITYND